MEGVSKSVFEQTVVATYEQLQILPENILSIFQNYTEGKLQPTSSEEVSNLLQCWFNGTLKKKMSLRVNSSTPPVILMLDSRATSDTRDNGSTVTFNIPNGVNAQTETQTAVIQLLEFQASHSIYNVDSTNNKLEIFVQFYDTTGVALSNTTKSTVVSILPGNYGASDLVTALNAAINTAC